MGKVPTTLQLPVRLWEAQDRRDRAEADDRATAAELTSEFVVSLLRVLARKDPGESFTTAERNACRRALSSIKRNWR